MNIIYLTKVEKFTLVFTISSFVLVFLLGSQGFILTPFFTINVEQPSDTNVEIDNIGMAQAKNAIIHVVSEKPLNMTSSVCLEQSKIVSEEKEFKPGLLAIIIVSFVLVSTAIIGYRGYKRTLSQKT